MKGGISSFTLFSDIKDVVENIETENLPGPSCYFVGKKRAFSLLVSSSGVDSQADLASLSRWLSRMPLMALMPPTTTTTAAAAALSRRGHIAELGWAELGWSAFLLC